MKIEIKGAREHNLKDINIQFKDGLTVVTGVSGSGKTSLVFDTLYHEAQRRFLEIFSLQRRLAPADVHSVHGVGPAVAVGQNLLNRNPGSTLATASGLHPFLRILFARFGERSCARCGNPISQWTEDEIIEKGQGLSQDGAVSVYAPLVRSAWGSHQTLLVQLSQVFGVNSLQIDGKHVSTIPQLDDLLTHDIDMHLADMDGGTPATTWRDVLQQAWSLGSNAVTFQAQGTTHTYSRAAVCPTCGLWYGALEPTLFNRSCPHCKGEGCIRCNHTGLNPEASAVKWHGLRLTNLLALTVKQARVAFQETPLPQTATRLENEITRRLDALHKVGLDYIALNRSSPTLSRGETQRVRLAVALTSRLEDIVHILDEPTIGLHPADVSRVIRAFHELAGPVIYVEHDRIAAAFADHAVDIGPGAGALGGEVVYQGDPAGLWQSDTATGRFFSLREHVRLPQARSQPDDFLTVRNANLRTLHNIDVPIALNRLNVVTGVSGSGKSTFVEDILAASLKAKEPVGCETLDGPMQKSIMVDQSPIGRNPRSNPATYTKLSGIIRDAFAVATGLSASHFSFNRPEGACPACKGIGAVEIKMRYMPSTWIPCEACSGQRFSEQVLAARAQFGGGDYSIADFYKKSISDTAPLITDSDHLNDAQRRNADRILQALLDIGLGYLSLGQPSPTLSGGEAQRVKLAKFLGKRSLKGQMLILDEPSTGLHPQDVSGLLIVLDRLVRSGATVVIVEHNTDIIRAADWLIDLGPGAGPDGGDLVYAGPFTGFTQCAQSVTRQALQDEDQIAPSQATRNEERYLPQGVIAIRGARANNLRNVDVDFPKGQMTVVTGVSGSGKSSLVNGVLQVEAQRRFMETLSMYERQGTREGAEAPVESVSGLGVAVTIEDSGRGAFGRRNTVGLATEIHHHLAVLFTWLGERRCPECSTPLIRRSADRGMAELSRGGIWQCPTCSFTAPLPAPRHFHYGVYAAACTKCHGVGTLRIPNPSKLMIHPEKPICGGAMFSPGFFPKGYLCKPMNGGYEAVQALAKVHGFNPHTTPWNEMDEIAQHEFLYGREARLEVEHQSRNGTTSIHQWRYPGFYGWVRDWDTGGTYTDAQVCPECDGARLRPEYATVTLAGHTLQAFSDMPLHDLAAVVDTLAAQAVDALNTSGSETLRASLETIRKRTHFLKQVGLGYLHLNRDAATLSAGEAQRIKLAGLLGSGLTSLTILIDEPSRGMHAAEIDALIGALHALRDEGHTVIVVEHDPGIIRAADYLLDIGPGPGTAGGEVVAQGVPEEVMAQQTLTAQWLNETKTIDLRPQRRTPHDWLTIVGAREHNLKGEEARLPLGCLAGVCGVSGSGKSTLMIDTLGRALSPKKITTSVAHMPVDPGQHDVISGAPKRAVLVDQVKQGIYSPAHFLGLTKHLHRRYADSDDAQQLGLDAKTLGKPCSVCRGSGRQGIDMGFLPKVYQECEVCKGTGYRPEAWDVKVHGIALPEALNLTLNEIAVTFEDTPKLLSPIKAAQDVGLGYLVMRQPGFAMSGGEAQRLKLAKELCRANNKHSLYILDEPSVGQHLEDVARLNNVLHRLVDAGHSVFVVEHHLHMLAACDWLLELGPGGGPAGGHIIAQGTPEQVAQEDTPTAPYLRELLN